MRYSTLGVLLPIILTQTVPVKAGPDLQPASLSTAAAPNGKAEHSAAAVRLSAQKGMAWLLDNPNYLRETRDVLWIMHEINKNYCRSPGLDRYIHAHHTCRRTAPPGFDMLFQRLLDCDTVSRERAESFLKAQPDNIWTWLPMALYCDISPLSEKAIKGIYDTTSSTGYVLTHQFVAMMFIEKAGCRDREKKTEFAEAMRRAAKRIELEQASAVDLDLYAERAALLGAAGYPELVSGEWINNIVASQGPSGRWGSNDPVGTAPHTTALALWALVQHLNECPLPSRPGAPGPEPGPGGP